jgi:hypothetical protein
MPSNNNIRQGLIRVRVEEVLSQILGTPSGPQHEIGLEIIRNPAISPASFQNIPSEDLEMMLYESFLSYELRFKNRNSRTRIVDALKEYQMNTPLEDRKTIYDESIGAHECMIEFLNRKIREDLSVSFECYKELQKRGYIPSHSTTRCESLTMEDSSQTYDEFHHDSFLSGGKNHDWTQTLLDIDHVSFVILNFPYLCMICHMIYRVYPSVRVSLIVSFPKMYSFLLKKWK